jgi:hypothetical protein
MKKTVCFSTLLLLLYSISNTVIADGLYLLSLEGSSHHRSSSVWTGKFVAADGRQFDTSNLYQAQNLLLSAKGVAAIDVNQDSSIILPFTLDAGYHSELYTSKPLVSFGIGYAATAERWQFSLIATDLLVLGGEVAETPCVDAFVREFHCGTGLPWVDYRLVQPPRNRAIKLSVKYAF